MTEPDPRLRIADSDRERAMADLAMHYADGRLDHEEYDERLDAIWTARTHADLAGAVRRSATTPGGHPRARRGQVSLTPKVAGAADPGPAHRAQHPHRGTLLAADLPADVVRAPPSRSVGAAPAGPRRLPAPRAAARLVDQPPAGSVPSGTMGR